MRQEKRVYKPGSVFDDHLSRPAIAGRLKQATRGFFIGGALLTTYLPLLRAEIARFTPD